MFKMQARCGVLLCACLAAQVCAAKDELGTVASSMQVLDEIMAIKAQGIPHALLSDAQAVAIIPNVVKLGFVVAGRRGNGVLLIRQDDGSWSNPLFLTLTGGSIGYQAGAQSTDVILVFKDRSNLDQILQSKFTLGADAAIAAGPVGRQTAAATDAQMRAKILSYSRSRGLFAGVSLDGSVLAVDAQANDRFYQLPQATAVEIFSPEMACPEPAQQLIELLTAYAPPSEAEEPALSGESAPADAQSRYLAAVGQLEAQLDERWRAYFTVEATGAGPAETLAAYEELLARFNKVATDRRYARLAELPEFHAAHLALRKFVAVLAGSEESAGLPPPPAGE